jgi:hypothetical protein
LGRRWFGFGRPVGAVEAEGLPREADGFGPASDLRVEYVACLLDYLVTWRDGRVGDERYVHFRYLTVEVLPEEACRRTRTAES